MFLREPCQRQFLLWAVSDSCTPTLYALPYIHTQIKQAIVEMYEATKRSFVRALATELASARTRVLHVAVDVWTAETSVHGLKYIGESVRSTRRGSLSLHVCGAFMLNRCFHPIFNTPSVPSDSAC